MGDQDKVQVMADANWTPAVTYWRERCEKAEARVKALVADLLEERENNAAEFADRMESQRKNRALEAEVARLTEERDSFVLEADALNEEKTILSDTLATERAGADALAARLRTHQPPLVARTDAQKADVAALSAHDARRKGGV